VKWIGEYPQTIQRGRNDVPAEIVFAGFIVRVVGQHLLQPVQADHVNAHGGARQILVADEGVRMLGLFREFGDAVGVIGGHDAEFIGALQRHVHDTDGDVGLALFVVGDHRTVVHLVDVIARQNQHMSGVMRAYELQILVHRVGGSAVPVRADLLLRRNELHEFAKLAAQIAPAALNVLDQRLRLVLGQHRDLPYAGVDAVRQHEIDDLELAAEWRRRLAAVLGERLEPFAASSRHHHRERAAGQSADIASGVITSSVSHTSPNREESNRPRARSQPAILGKRLHLFSRCRFRVW